MAIGATAPQAHRRARQRLELRLRFDVEAEDVFLEPEVHLAQRLADAGKDDPLARHARRPRPPQFPLADDVHSGAEPRQRRQHRLIRIGLHRVEKKRVLAGERVAERVEMLLDRRVRIAIEGRSDGFGDRRQSDVLGVKSAVAIGEGRHAVDGLFQQEIEEEWLIRRFDRRDRRLAQRAQAIRVRRLRRRIGVGRRLERAISAASRNEKREQGCERQQAPAPGEMIRE